MLRWYQIASQFDLQSKTLPSKDITDICPLVQYKYEVDKLPATATNLQTEAMSVLLEGVVNESCDWVI